MKIAAGTAENRSLFWNTVLASVRKTMVALVASGAFLSSPSAGSAEPPAAHKKEKATGPVRFPVENPEAAEKLSAKLIGEYLNNNVDRALLLEEMRPTIEEFRSLSPSFVLRKCMDGRLQGPNAKGCPETIIYFGRSHGAIADPRPDNYDLWNPIQQSMVKSDPQHPALFIAAGHTMCAAHKKEGEPVGQTNKRALLTVQDQVHDVVLSNRKAGNEKNLVALAALTDTNNLGMTLYRPDGSLFYDAQKVMEAGSLRKPASVFDPDFLREVISEDYAHESIKGKTMAELLGGSSPLAFAHGRETIALETYLLKRLTMGAKDGSLKKKPLLTNFVQGHVNKAMDEDFPESMRPFMTHLLAWNTAHALYRTQYLEDLKGNQPEAYRRDVEHDERVLALGNSGFDTLRRNEVVLIKPGSYDDRKAISIGSQVLEEVYAHNKPGHYPLVHINIELEGPIETKHQLSVVLARMRTKTNLIRVVFGSEARIFTTYSYHHTVQGPLPKVFYPLNPSPSEKDLVVPHDLMQGVSPETFDAKTLREREKGYIEHSRKSRVEQK